MKSQSPNRQTRRLKQQKVRMIYMENTTTRELTAEELKELIESMPEGTVISIEIKVVLEDG